VEDIKMKTIDRILELAKRQEKSRKSNGNGAEHNRQTKPAGRQGESILDTVYKFLGRFVSYPSEHARIAHALWCLHAHLMHLWDTTARLAFLSPEPASGKTRALEATELLVPNPVMAVNVSPAYLFRKVGSENGAPTILFDEIDTVFGPKAKENEEVRGLLNAGHRRGAVAGRCVVHGKTVLTEEIPAYAAVALAGLGWLPDTIMTRAIVIPMRRRAKDECIEPFRRRIHVIRGEEIRGLIAAWAHEQPDEVKWPELPEGVEDRDADKWEALIAVADMVGGDWPKRARDAAVALVAASKQAEPSLGVRLLMDSETVFGESESIFTKVLIQQLIALPESPWGDLRGKPLDERGLAHRLRQYSIKSRQIRIGGVGPLKGYQRADFADAWKRYRLPPDKSDTADTSDTKPPLRQQMYWMYRLYRLRRDQEGQTRTATLSTLMTREIDHDLRQARSRCLIQKRPQGWREVARLQRLAQFQRHRVLVKRLDQDQQGRRQIHGADRQAEARPAR
jgi:hypothetical protein